MKKWYPWQLKKIKILGAILELPARQHCQSIPFTCAYVNFSNFSGCRMFILCEIHCYLCPKCFGYNNSVLAIVTHQGNVCVIYLLCVVLLMRTMYACKYKKALVPSENVNDWKVWVIFLMCYLFVVVEPFVYFRFLFM